MISTYLQEYADYLKTNERSPMTVAGYTNDISLFIRWYVQNHKRIGHKLRIRDRSQG
jgi:site-specific recombinase XerC